MSRTISPNWHRGEHRDPTKHCLHSCVWVGRERACTGLELCTCVVRAEEDVRADDALEALNVRMHDRATKEVEVEVVLQVKASVCGMQGVS